MSTCLQPFSTPAPPSPLTSHRTEFEDDRSSSGDSPPLTDPLPIPERSEYKNAGSNHDESTSSQPPQSPPLPPSYARPSTLPPRGAYGGHSPHRPRRDVYDVEGFDSLGDTRHLEHRRPPRSRRSRRHSRSRSRSRHRLEYSDVPAGLPPPPPFYSYHPAYDYQGSDYPFSMPHYAHNHSNSPYTPHDRYQSPSPQPYQSPIPYPYSTYPPQSPSSPQHPPPGRQRFDHRYFRTVRHRFAGWLYKIRTDAAPRSKKLKVKRVGGAIEFYCSDPRLCSKIEILMACIVADLFEPPWEMDNLHIAWGVSECHDIGDGNSLLVSVNKETPAGAAAMLDSLSRRSSMADSSSSSYHLERRSSGPLVSQLDAFQRLGSYDRSRGFHSPRSPNVFDSSQVVAVLRQVELITARQLAKQSYLQSSDAASVIGTKQPIFTSDHVHGKFDATVPTLFGLLVSKVQVWRRRPISRDGYHDYLYTSSDYSDSATSSPSSSGHKTTDNFDTESLDVVIAGGEANIIAHNHNDYPNDLEPISGAGGISADESQESGDDPFSQWDNSDTDTENNMENVLHLPFNNDRSKYYSEQDKDIWHPGTSPEIHKMKGDDFTISDNKVVPSSVTTAQAADPSSAEQDVAPVDHKDTLPPLPGNTTETSVRNDIGDNVTSPTQEETNNPPAGVKVVQHRDEKFEVRTNIQTDITQPSAQGISIAAVITHQDMVGQGAFEPPIRENLNAHDDNISNDEDQTQAQSPSHSLDDLEMLTEKDSAVQHSDSADECESLDEDNTLVQPDRETGTKQSVCKDMSASEGETEGNDTSDKHRELKPILRVPGERSHRDETSYRVKFSLPFPEHVGSDEEFRRRESQDETRKTWEERRSDQERGSYPPRPHTTPHQYSNPSSIPASLGMDYYGFPEALEYPSEGSAYKEAVNAGQVYERPFEASQPHDAPKRRSSNNSNAGSTQSIDLDSLDARSKPSHSSLQFDDFGLPPPVTSRRFSRFSGRSSRLSRNGSEVSSDDSSESRRTSFSHQSGKDNPAQHVAKEILTITLGGIIVILSVLAIALDPAEEENWFKRIEEGIFVMFSLGIPFLLAISSRLAEDLEILTPETEREVRSLRELRSMNKKMDDEEFMKQLQKAILLDEELGALFSFENACYKLSRKPGKLVVPMRAVYSDTFKMVWFFGEELAFNRILGKVFRYRHENNVLYIDKEPVDVEGVVVHVRRRVDNYSLSSALES